MSATFKHDFAVYSPDGSLALVVEAKARKGTTAQWATALRTNLIESRRLSTETMFLLATPTALYVWLPGEPADAQASNELVAERLFRPYYEAAGIASGAADPTVFEFIVGAWLRDVVRGTAGRDPGLDKTRLPSLLGGGRVEGEAMR